MESRRQVARKGKALEKASALEKAEPNPSSLATKLLHLWGSGLLSATMIRELASLAMEDGASHPELVKLAESGNWGAQPGNIHRQVMGKFCSNVKLAEPFKVTVNCIDAKTSLEKLDQAAVFLPHLQFAHLAEYYPMCCQEAFSLGKGNLEKFWHGVQEVGDDRLEGHPMCLEKHWQEKSIPAFLHGDGVEYHNRDTMMVWSWGCMLGEQSSLEKHMLLAAFPKSCTTKETWPAIWKVLSWSFKALGKGLHPTHDSDGKPLEKDSPLFGKAGQPLHPRGFRAYVFAIQGDHEFYSNHLGLPHWASHYPCWECPAENFPACDPSLHVKELDLEKASFDTWTHQEHLEDPWSDYPLFSLPHVSAKNIRGDPMHILFCKGVYSHVLGGVLHYACWWEGPGKVCKEKPWKRLGFIFDEIQEQYRSQELSNRLTNLRLSMFTDANKPWASKASLDIKAGEAKHLLPAVVPVLEKLFGPSMHLREEERKMISAAKSLEKLVALWDEAETFLTPSQFAKSMALGKEFLLSYKWLNSWSLEKDRNSFAIVIKHHTFIHLLLNSKYMNPRRQWCFRGEDFVGHVSKMAHSISFGVSSTKISTKLCPKYRIFFHLLMTRGLEKPLWVEEDDTF